VRGYFWGVVVGVPDMVVEVSVKSFMALRAVL
jgi:hypothetical protein